MMPHNQTDASNSDIKKAFLPPFEMLLVAYEKPTSDCYFVMISTPTHFRLFGVVQFPVLLLLKYVPYRQ
jgi:hypothetical protein